MDPFTDAEMSQWRSERERLLQQYSTDFKRDYGWAIPLFGRSPNFRELEELASLKHLRGYYRWASHEVHSGSRGLDLNIFERGDGAHYRLTGRTDEGFAEPGTMALVSLNQTLNSLIGSGSDGDFSPRDLLGCMAIQVLLNECDDAFVAGDAVVTEAHERHAMRTGGRCSNRVILLADGFRSRAESIAGRISRAARR